MYIVYISQMCFLDSLATLFGTRKVPQETTSDPPAGYYGDLTLQRRGEKKGAYRKNSYNNESSPPPLCFLRCVPRCVPLAIIRAYRVLSRHLPVTRYAPPEGRKDQLDVSALETSFSFPLSRPRRLAGVFRFL